MPFDVFAKGGPVMLVLAALSVYVLAVILFKAYQFAVGNVLAEDGLDEAIEDIRSQRFEKAQQGLATSAGPIFEVARAALMGVRDRSITRETREKEVQRVGARQIRLLESHLRGLDLVANIGPLLGLLGTVIGMVNAFSRLQQQGARIDPSQLAGGIWEALLTTVGGLAVAIPALAAYYILDGMIERIRARMKDATVQILAVDDALLAAENEQRRHEEAAHKLRLENERRAEEEKRRMLEIEAKEKEANSNVLAPQKNPAKTGIQKPDIFSSLTVATKKS